MSPIDKIFQDIFGYLPKKSGTAYEMLSCIAEHLLNQGDVQHDAKIRGSFSKTLYQIDVLSSGDGYSKSMGEAKDYTMGGKKVGRGDLQKLGGALPDLNDISKGRFYSATGYTEPAKKYAKAPFGKPIELFEFRPSTVEDEKGTIQTIVINMTFMIPSPQNGSWTPHFTDKGKESFRSLLKEGENELKFNMKLEEFYDELGTKILSLYELTSQGYGEVDAETLKACGCYLLPGKYIAVDSILGELRGLEYEIPYSSSTQTLEISTNGNLRFVVKDNSGEVIRFVTDEQIKLYRFSEDGGVIAP